MVHKLIRRAGSPLLLVFALLAGVVAGPVAGSAPERVNVLIGFTGSPGPAEEALVRRAGGQVRYRYHLVDAIAATIPEAALARLGSASGVAHIEPDLPLHAVDIELDNAWGVSRVGAGIVHEQYGNRGAGVKVAIIDSGINYRHPDLDDNYVAGEDFVELDGDPWDVYGHGTHVAGTVCAEDNDNGDAAGPYGVVGVAPACSLYSLKVLDDAGWGLSSNLIAALEWAVDRDIQVANLSLGWDQDPGEVVEAAFVAAEGSGMVLVAAACNNGNRPGKGENVCWPGKYGSVIAVAATDSSDVRATFSSTGPEVEIAAPGVAVLSTWNDTTGYATPDPVCHYEEGIEDVCYKFGSGTSMAAPHVAGVAALLIASGEIADMNSNGRTNDEVRQRLVDMAEDLGAAGWDPWYGYGLVDAAMAVIGPVVPTGPIIESIVPAAIPGGATTAVALGGSGFAQGAVVTFEGGRGTKPLASGIVVSQDGTAIALDVTIGVVRKPAQWDVRVTNPNGETVIRLGGLTILP